MKVCDFSSESFLGDPRCTVAVLASLVDDFVDVKTDEVFLASGFTFIFVVGWDILSNKTKGIDDDPQRHKMFHNKSSLFVFNYLSLQW